MIAPPTPWAPAALGGQLGGQLGGVPTSWAKDPYFLMRCRLCLRNLGHNLGYNIRNLGYKVTLRTDGLRFVL